ncbi:hypothetical protein PR003_g4761 [Phytophthora rubi]|uniref:Ubiquitin-like protease family profile domain-containing protein n=1 Tax=Phytophthora rubi TaxID=129364 RepID=A0A6A3NIZ6_9STRA|nr:hypothetical protein PR002_g4678 [Phytophthora rubi]KAE9045770.1 hypothetical protein PR001_g4835 [Phytophthora rubi]KAE9351729.1 hypothetical protein PR003_g4761 [Phytophthora rubi]
MGEKATTASLDHPQNTAPANKGDANDDHETTQTLNVEPLLTMDEALGDSKNKIFHAFLEEYNCSEYATSEASSWVEEHLNALSDSENENSENSTSASPAILDLRLADDSSDDDVGAHVESGMMPVVDFRVASRDIDDGKRGDNYGMSDDNSSAELVKDIVPATKSSFTIPTNTNRSGLSNQPQRKASNREAMNAALKRIEAMRKGETPISLEVVDEARQVAAPYTMYARRLQELKIRLLKRSVVTVAHRSCGKVPIPTDRIQEVLTLPTLRSCTTKLSMFMSHWNDEHDACIAEKDCVVTVSGKTYSADTLQLMRCWHDMISRFNVVSDTLEWVRENPHAAFTCDGALGDDVPPMEEVIKRVEQMPVLNIATMAAMTLSQKQQLSEQCLDETIERLILLYGSESNVLTVPSNWLCLPELPTSHRVSTIPPAFETLKSVGAQGVDDQDVFLVAVINVDENHWCGVAVVIKSESITIFDPQQNTNRIDRIGALVEAQVVPELPEPTSRYVYTIHAERQFQKQTDNYNCGVFVLLFIELAISDGSLGNVVGDGVVIKSAMQFFRYRYLCFNLIPKDEYY